MSSDARPWDDAYEQLTYEKGACNLVQKYTPRLVRERVFAERNATLVIMVRVEWTWACQTSLSCLLLRAALTLQRVSPGTGRADLVTVGHVLWRASVGQAVRP